MSKPITRKQTLAAREMLAKEFPQTFRGFKQPKLPLKVGIYHDIRHALPEMKSKLVAAALNNYVNGPTYLEQLQPGAPRIGLDGQPHGKVTPEASQAAAERAAEIKVYRASQEARRKVAETETTEAA